jgi:hypothetical protein
MMRVETFGNYRVSVMGDCVRALVRGGEVLPFVDVNELQPGDHTVLVRFRGALDEHMWAAVAQEIAEAVAKLS